MTLQSAAEQALRELTRLHVEAGECSHPHECPVVQAIADLELALGEMEQFETNEAGEPCTDCDGSGITSSGGMFFNCPKCNPEPIRLRPEPLHPETLAAIGRMRCPLPEQP